MAQITIAFYNTHLMEDSYLALGKGSVWKDGERKPAILQKLQEFTPCLDVIGLTEVWAEKWEREIAGSLRTQHPGFGAYYPRDFGGIRFWRQALAMSGMVIAAKDPSMDNWSLSNNFRVYEDLTGADMGANKGVNFGDITVDGVPIRIVQTHMQASYTDGDEAEYRSIRTNGFDKVISPVLQSSRPTFLLGDLNIVGESAEYDTFNGKMGKLKFQDAWTAFSPGQPGFTYDPAHNNSIKHWDPSQTEPQRLDYIYFSQGDKKVTCTDFQIMSGWKLSSGFDLSDHYAVIATFDIS